MDAIDPGTESIADQALREIVFPHHQGLPQALVGLGLSGTHVLPLDYPQHRAVPGNRKKLEGS